MYQQAADGGGVTVQFASAAPQASSPVLQPPPTRWRYEAAVASRWKVAKA